MARKLPARRVPRARNAGAVDEPPKSRGRSRSKGPSAEKKPGRKTGKGSASPASRPSAPERDARRATPSGAIERAPAAPARPATPSGRTKGLWLYGRHAVEAALANPRRSCHRLTGTAEALDSLPRNADRSGLQIEHVEREDLDRRFGETAVHQGVALSVAPLPKLDLERACRPEPGGRNLVLLLDQVQDPHNLGAILRSAAAFDARAVVVPDRNSAPLGAVAAKAASGALDLVPIVEVTNLARALDALQGLGYWRLALDGSAEMTIDDAPDVANLALVLGAEGRGVRRLVAERSDLRVRLPVAPAMESLNVSVACGIALYALSRRLPGG